MLKIKTKIPEVKLRIFNKKKFRKNLLIFFLELKIVLKVKKINKKINIKIAFLLHVINL